ncbi:MAG: DUF559 domain-containing protein [Parvularculaceae bacterium]
MARFDLTREKTKAAKRLRREATPAERALWRRLKQRQLDHLKFRRRILGPYVLDFYCPELKPLRRTRWRPAMGLTTNGRRTTSERPI